ncbi:AAA family ATPase [Streptococcus penaeicida]
MKNENIFSEDLSKNFKNLTNSWMLNLFNLRIENIEIVLEDLINLKEDFERLYVFSFMSKINNTAILIGPNGSGKTTLINSLRKFNSEQMFVIPAQKFLYFSSNNHMRNDIRRDKYIELVKKFVIKTDKITLESMFMDNNFEAPFTQLITLMVKEYSIKATKKQQGLRVDNDTIFEKLTYIWSRLIPNISLFADAENRTLEICKDGKKYSINSLSDGEKSILFYIGNILIAPENSFIVVDEPETYLNSAIYNHLWDLLISERNDCQFVFASHNLDFIQSRANSTYIWCHEYKSSTEFTYDILDGDYEIPLSLIIEISGARKQILFCEGTKTSLDYQIYSKLFENRFLVKPVTGHKDVINYTRAFNKLSTITKNNAIGIIDNDWNSEETILKYEKDLIFTTPFNEIEMLLLDENVIRDVISSFKTEEEIDASIQNFKNSLIAECKNNISKIISVALKKRVDDYVSQNLILTSTPTVNDISQYFSKLGEGFRVDEEISKIETKIDNAFKNNDFDKILNICNLKGQILNGLGNTLLESKYSEKAIARLYLNSELRETLIQKYFQNIKC